MCVHVSILLCAFFSFFSRCLIHCHVQFVACTFVTCSNKDQSINQVWIRHFLRPRSTCRSNVGDYIARYWSKIAVWIYSTAIWRPHWGWPLWNFAESFGVRKLESLGYRTALYGRRQDHLCRTPESRPVTARPTHDCNHIIGLCRASIASRGNKKT